MSWQLSCVVLAAVMILGGVLLSGCRVGYPFRGPGYDPKRGVVGQEPNRSVVVAFTRGQVAPGRGGQFRRDLELILNRMNEHDGLIGYTVRKQLLGRRVWTISVWTDEDALYRFVYSPEHRQAMQNGGILKGSFVTKIMQLPASAIPPKWELADRLLDEQAKAEENR